jgi:homoserine dehydrogenase
LKEIRVGILGLGSVGRSLVKIIQDNHIRIMKEYGIDIKVKRVYGKKEEIAKLEGVKDIHITNNVEEVIFGDRIDIVCETMAGQDPEVTRKHIIRTLKGKKSVIISSSKALATDMKEIIKAVADNKVNIKYDACVGGGIPVAKVLGTTFAGDTLKSIGGVVSSDANYIYSIMGDQNISFEEALEMLKKIKYEEGEEFIDILEHDILSELVILGLFAMNTVIDINSMKPINVHEPDKKDFMGFSKLGYKIKPMGILKKVDEELQYYAGPVAVDSGSVFGSIGKDNCLIFLEGEKYGRLGLLSENRGGDPTALAMFDDLINLLTLKRTKNPVKINIHENPPKNRMDGKFILRVPCCDGLKDFITEIKEEEGSLLVGMIEIQGELFLETDRISWERKDEFIKSLLEDGIEIKSCVPIFC